MICFIFTLVTKGLERIKRYLLRWQNGALPKLEHREMKTLPVEQLTSFLREAKERGVFEMYYVELATGLRRGELLGLKWEDIDLDRGNLRVKRQIARINGEIVEVPLKTKNAYRTLPLAEDTIAVLKQQRKKVGNSPWVFPSPIRTITKRCTDEFSKSS